MALQNDKHLPQVCAPKVDFQCPPTATIAAVPSRSEPQPASPADYNVILGLVLAAATLALTCVAVVIGVVAIFGYKEFKKMILDKAGDEAGRKSNEITAAYLKSEDFRKDVKVTLEEIHRQHSLSNLKSDENVRSPDAHENGDDPAAL